MSRKGKKNPLHLTSWFSSLWAVWGQKNYAIINIIISSIMSAYIHNLEYIYCSKNVFWMNEDSGHSQNNTRKSSPSLLFCSYLDVDKTVELTMLIFKHTPRFLKNHSWDVLILANIWRADFITRSPLNAVLSPRLSKEISLYQNRSNGNFFAAFTFETCLINHCSSPYTSGSETLVFLTQACEQWSIHPS